MDNYIEISFHLVASLALGCIIWRIFGSNNRKSLLISLLFALLGGILIDIDHFLDYFLSFGFNFNFDYFVRGEYFSKGRAYIIFHGFEYIILFGLLALLAKSRVRKMIFVAIALGMLSHLLIDTFLFPNPIKGYFIIYRLLHGFNVDMSKGILE